MKYFALVNKKNVVCMNHLDSSVTVRLASCKVQLLPGAKIFFYWRKKNSTYVCNEISKNQLLILMPLVLKHAFLSLV